MTAATHPAAAHPAASRAGLTGPAGPPPAPPSNAGLFLQYVQPLGRQLVVVFLVLLGSIALQLLNPQLLSRFIDTAQAGQPLPALIQLALFYLVSSIGLQGLLVAQAYLGGNIGLLATNRLRAHLALHVLQLDLAFHNARTPGELIERVDGDVGTLSNFFSTFAVQIVGNALLLLGVLVLFFTVHLWIGLAMLAFTVAALLAINAVRNIGTPYWNRARQAAAELYGFLEERLASTEDVRANGATAYVLLRFYQRMRQRLRWDVTANVIGVTSGSLTIALFALGAALSLGLGAYFYLQGALSLGAVYLVFNYSQLLNRPLEQLSRQFQDWQQAGASLNRVRQLFTERPRLLPGATELPAGPLAVEFDTVTFGYAEDAILRDVTLRLAPGEVLGLLGRTGSGKTTLTRLLFRLYDPTSGFIRLDGRALPELTLESIRTRVGLVTQDIQLFHASVRDNLTFFDSSIPDAAILSALSELGLWEWYQALPAGLDTRLAAGGGGLSAGQAQLLAFARVFLKDPAVVVLDEASSRLDPATEQRVERAVDRLLRGRTVIIIAHRLATVQRADTIMILDSGQTVEFGPRAALAADPDSRFARLLQVGLSEVLA
jgi:ATP-binding cassette subfamily B protein